MMPYQSYQQWEIERIHTLAEQRAADRRRGEAAAASYGSLRKLRGFRLRVQRPATPSPVPSHVAARGHTAAVACNTEV